MGNNGSEYTHQVFVETWSGIFLARIGRQNLPIMMPGSVDGSTPINYCIFGRIHVISEPGANRIDGMAEIHKATRLNILGEPDDLRLTIRLRRHGPHLA